MHLKFDTRAMARVLVFALASASPVAHAFPVYVPEYETVIELANDHTGDYRIVRPGSEADAVIAGIEGPGWRRTGYLFYSDITMPRPADAPPLAAVCRFRAAVSGSRFYTADPGECEGLKKPWTGWVFEGLHFRTVAPAAGACPSDLVPIYRIASNRGDSTHRFTPDERVRRRQLQEGWIDEGIAFCAAGYGRGEENAFVASAADATPRERCDVPAHTGGSCIVMRNLLLPTRYVDKTLNANFFAPPNPAWSPSWDELTGWGSGWGRMFTADATFDATSVGRSTFVVAGPYHASTGEVTAFGLHLDSTERLGGELASVGLERRFPSAVQPGVPDGRVMPWRGTRDSDLFVGLSIGRAKVIRAAPGGHVYALPLLKFVDVTSGRGVLITLQAFGTVPPGDFAGSLGNGDAVVSTVFRANPGFGTRLWGEFAQCFADAGGGTCAPHQGQNYRLRIGLDDFREVLRRARAAEPGLSPDPADYRLDTLECRVESYGDVELGVTMSACEARLTY